MPPAHRLHIIIPAGGIGTRMGLAYPKQLMPFGNKTVLEHTVGLFHPHPVVVAIPSAHRTLFVETLSPETQLVDGGPTRFESVRNAFEALSNVADDDLIVIHDAARPFFDPKTLNPACEVARENGAVIFASRATDTVKQAGNDGTVQMTLDRDTIYLAQTPQIFKACLLRAAYAQASGDWVLTDEAALMERVGVRVQIFRSSPANRKLTTPEDLSLLDSESMRIGHGYDVHQFDEARPLFLGGVAIPGGPGLLGHSDADVVLHALIDALLGATGQGDIGHWFPDNDPNFKGVRSTVLLGKVVASLSQKGYRLVNADITVMAQIPKLAPHISQMRSVMATALDVSENCVNIKATTTEGLGFVGRKEGMAAQAVVLVTRRQRS